MEQKVLKGLKALGKKAKAEEIAQAAGIEKVQAERFGYSLSQKGIVKLEKKIEKSIKATALGKVYLEKGLPEERVLYALKEGKLTLNELAKKTELTENEISACFSILKKNAWVTVCKECDGIALELTSLGKEQLKKESLLKSVVKGEADANLISEFKKRGLVEISTNAVYELELVKELGKLATSKTEHQLTHEMLKTGSWREKKFRAYDLQSEVPKVYAGKLHPLIVATNKIRRIFLELGFEETAGPLVESSFWNFDALFQPQDHPARDLADTFYLKNPKECSLPNNKIVEEVKKAHEQGTRNSRGWQYSWNRELAKKPVLRTHTTAVTVRQIAKIEPPAKVFSIGRVFRNETVDFKHLPEFTQVDGIVADENATFKDLLGYLKEFYYRIGFEKIRFRPSYFPYTEMSVEPEIFLKEKGIWLEMGGAGIFRPEVTEPLGVDVPVLAWGLSLERPVMLKLGLDDIRVFYYRNDVKWLREVPIL